MPKICMIVATNSTKGIGYKNNIPWRLPEDLQYFRAVTMGFPVIMGRKTFDSLPSPLKGRLNIVVSSTIPETPIDNVVYCLSYSEALEHAQAVAKAENKEKIFIIGGSSAYNYFKPSVEELHLTTVDVETPQDTVFTLDDLPAGLSLRNVIVGSSEHEPFLGFSIYIYSKE